LGANRLASIYAAEVSCPGAGKGVCRNEVRPRKTAGRGARDYCKLIRVSGVDDVVVGSGGWRRAGGGQGGE
jgi:hypothetical protein